MFLNVFIVVFFEFMGATRAALVRPKECWGFATGSHRRAARSTAAHRAHIAAESMMPGVKVADIARKHGTTRCQIYDWRGQIRKGNLVVPEKVAAHPMAQFQTLHVRQMVTLPMGWKANVNFSSVSETAA